MADKQMFLQLMSAQAGGDPQMEYKLYDGLMDQWWGKVRFLLSTVVSNLIVVCSLIT